MVSFHDLGLKRPFLEDPTPRILLLPSGCVSYPHRREDFLKRIQHYLPHWVPAGPQRAICDNNNVMLLAKFQELWLGEIGVALHLCGSIIEQRTKLNPIIKCNY